MPKAFYGLRRKSLKGNFLSLVTIAALLTISACTSAQSITDIYGPQRFKDQLYFDKYKNVNSRDSTFTVDPNTGLLIYVVRGLTLMGQPGVDSIRIINNGGTIISYTAGVATTWNLTTFHAFASLNYNSTRIIYYNINLDPLPDSVRLPHTYLNVSGDLTKTIVGDTVTVGHTGGGGSVTPVYQLLTATGGQTTFSFTSVPTTSAGFYIAINGVIIPKTYYSISTNDIIFSAGLVAGDKVILQGIQ